jgi:hypothetical protein
VDDFLQMLIRYFDHLPEALVSLPVFPTLFSRCLYGLLVHHPEAAKSTFSFYQALLSASRKDAIEKVLKTDANDQKLCQTIILGISGKLPRSRMKDFCDLLICMSRFDSNLFITAFEKVSQL